MFHKNTSSCEFLRIYNKKYKSLYVMDNYCFNVGENKNAP